MNSRGQAALEYLMTYGWALVIIVVVAGILFFIMSSPAGSVVCNSSDPAKMPVQSSNITKTSPGTVKIINGTAGTITWNACAAGTTFTSCGASPPAAGTTYNGGAVISLSPAGTFTSALDSNTSMTIQYTDQFSYAKTVRVTCSGTPQ